MNKPDAPQTWTRFLLTAVFLLGGFYLVAKGEGEAVKIGGGAVMAVGAILSVAWGVIKTPGGGGTGMLLAGVVTLLGSLPGCLGPGGSPEYVRRDAVLPSAEALVTRHDALLRGEAAPPTDPVEVQTLLNESTIFLALIRGETLPPLPSGVPGE